MRNNNYFLHSNNAKDDYRCVLLIEQLGLEGYGILWVLSEILHNQGNKYPISLIPTIARKYNTTEEKVKMVIMNYDLFQIESVNNEEFFSDRNLKQ